MLSAENLKLVILFMLLLVTFFFSMLPLLVHRASRRRAMAQTHRRLCKAVVSVLSCFAAGVFIGVCLLDLFPEVQENINSALRGAGFRTKFPLPEFVVVIGFLLLLTVEQFVLTWKATSRPDQYAPLLEDDFDSLTSSYNSVGPAVLPEVPTVGFSSANNEDQENGDVTGEDGTTEQAYVDPSSHSIMRSIILLVALSLHSLFEGLAVGLQRTVDDTVKLITAVALHKCIIAFSVGLNMVQSRLGLRAVIASNVVFSLASPIGIGVGIAVVEQWHQGGTASNAVVGALEGLACGTFIYVVFFEILPHEFIKKKKVPTATLR